MREVELGLGLAFWRRKVKEDGKVNGGFIEASVAVAEGRRQRDQDCSMASYSLAYGDLNNLKK